MVTQSDFLGDTQMFSKPYILHQFCSYHNTDSQTPPVPTVAIKGLSARKLGHLSLISQLHIGRRREGMKGRKYIYALAKTLADPFIR